MRLTQLTQWHSCLDLGDSGSTRRARAQAVMGTGEMALLGLFPSLWPLCPSEDQAWRWCSCLGHGEPGSTRYAGKPVATGTADMVPVESSSSFWQLAFKGLSGWSFFVAWHSRCSLGHPWLGSISIAQCSRCSNDPSGWGPSLLLFRPSGTQRALSLRSFSILLEKENTAVGTYVVRERGHSDGSNPCM